MTTAHLTSNSLSNQSAEQSPSPATSGKQQSNSEMATPRLALKLHSLPPIKSSQQKATTEKADKVLEALKSFCDYDPELGTFIKRCNPPGRFTRGAVGKPVDYAHNRGYRCMWLLEAPWLIHRLVWLWHHGELASIDHIDGDKTNNRIENLRAVSQEYNARNARMRKDNTSGHSGITWCKVSYKWKVLVQLNGKRTGLGYYLTLEGAIAARDTFYLEHPELGYTKRHGKA